MDLSWSMTKGESAEVVMKHKFAIPSAGMY